MTSSVIKDNNLNLFQLILQKSVKDNNVWIYEIPTFLLFNMYNK